MASLVRVAFLKMSNPTQGGIAACTFVQHRNITGKAMRENMPPRPPKPAPFDYENKFYTLFRSVFDKTTHRFDENSKVVVVDGPVAAGKTIFASGLAEDLGMKHFPEANMDYHYVRDNGYDIRKLDDRVPEDTRTFDHINFNLSPKHRNAAAYQIMMYEARYAQYIDALAHVLNTGQGVVLERSPYSDFVFVEAMASQGYISKQVKNFYYDIRVNTIEELMRPHLVVYLDLPVNKVQEAIKNRGHCHEVKGSALTTAFLTEIERQYKDRYLRDISTHAELLVYDWTGGGDAEVVVEDIERLDFEKFVEREDPKMKDWRLPREVEWADKRMIFTNHKAHLLNNFNIPNFDIPELIMSADDAYERDQVINSLPEFQYLKGYGDKDSTVLKTKLPKYTEHL